MSSSQPRLRQRAAFGVLVVALVMGTTACASRSADTAHAGSNSAATTQTGGKPDPEYKGTDLQYLRLLDKPKIKEGTTFKIGYLQAAGFITVLKNEQEAAAEAVKELGGTMIVKDAQANPASQVSQLNELLSQNVDAIIGYPLVPDGLSAGVKAAQERGIPVIWRSSYYDTTTPPAAGRPFDVGPATDYSVYVTMKALAKKLPKGAKLGIITSSNPNPALKYQAERQTFWAQQFGLDVIDTRSPTEPATQEQKNAAAAAMLTQHPDVQAIVGTDDGQAIATVSAARAAGRTDLLIATSSGGDPLAIPFIKSGAIAVDYWSPWALFGTQTVYAAYSELTKQGQPLAGAIQVVGPVQVVTKENVDSVVRN